MTSSPMNLRLPIAGGLHQSTADAYDGQTVLGQERRYTIPERLTVTGTATVNSAVIPAAGVRLLLLGVSVDWGATAAGAAAVVLQATLAGSGILGTSDQAAGSFTPVTPILRVPAGTLAGSLAQMHPAGLCVVTREGDGTNALFRVVQTAGVADVYSVTVYYAPIYSEDLPC